MMAIQSWKASKMWELLSLSLASLQKISDAKVIEGKESWNKIQFTCSQQQQVAERDFYLVILPQNQFGAVDVSTVSLAESENVIFVFRMAPSEWPAPFSLCIFIHSWKWRVENCLLEVRHQRDKVEKKIRHVIFWCKLSCRLTLILI